MQIFSFKSDIFSEVASFAGMHLGIHKSYHSCINDEKSIRNIKSPKASEKTIINISKSVSGEFLETYAIFDKELLFTKVFVLLSGLLLLFKRVPYLQ